MPIISLKKGFIIVTLLFKCRRYIDMNKIWSKFLLSGVLLIGYFIVMGNVLYAQNTKINWLTWEQAQEMIKVQKKKVIVDLYTDYCGWCKQMDNTTLQDPAIIKYINANFYAIKFNAEFLNDIEFKGKTYKFMQIGKRGVHELAIEITNTKLSYPTFVFMDESFNTIQPLKGYQSISDFEAIINYFGGNFYKTTPWNIYKDSFRSATPAENNPSPRKVNNQN